MEKAVKGATKIKLAPPKAKYVSAILSATAGGDAGVAEVFRTLQIRLRDSTWTIVFKALIVVHLMIRDGEADVTLRYVAESPKRLAISSFTEVQIQGSNIRRYSEYLLERVRGYRDTKVDFVRAGAGKLKKLTVEKGLLRETEAVQNQIRALLKCDMLGAQDPDNEITLTAFRLLTMDLLELFKVMNEGTINVLEHYFEMSRPDAERALNIYKTFGRQADQVVQYLSLARQYETSTRLEVPVGLKHAPTTLTSSLEEYLNDPDFEINRRQYLVQQQAKMSGTSSASLQPTIPPASAPKHDTSFPAPTNMNTAQNYIQNSTQNYKQNSAPQAKGPAPDLIDFFGSIEPVQQPVAQQPYSGQVFHGSMPQIQYQQQSSMFQPQQSGYNPFLQQSVPQQQLQPDFTGAGFGGYTPQPQGQVGQQQQQKQQQQQQQPFGFQPQLTSIPQNGMAEFSGQSVVQSPIHSIQPQQTSTNPFRQSMIPTGVAGPSINSPTTSLSRQPTNPFAKHNGSGQPQQMGNGFYEANNSNAFASMGQQSPFRETTSNSTSMSQLSTQQQSQAGQFMAPTQSPQKTGTNPFAKNLSPPPLSSPALIATPTGSTNPFRQSAFVNQQTGQGWQYSNQGNFSGYDVNNIDTVPVFPRPGQH